MRMALIASLAILLQSAALAQGAPADPQAEFKAAVEAANKAKVSGPSDIKLADQGVLKLPAGLIYIPAQEAGRLLQAMGNRIGDGLLGMVMSSEGNWFVVMRLVKAGYVKDDDAKDWKADELLSGIKEGTEESNKERRARGLPEIEVLSWVEAPAYDAGTHRLVWSLASKLKGEPDSTERSVNYNTYALGRDGYISMNLVTGMKTVQAEKPIAHQLLAALQYHDGKRYSDFNSSTDHVAEYGLAALIGGIAAKKLGLFALIAAFVLKFAKAFALAAVGLAYALTKFFRRKKVAGSPPPQA
jgi:uncharacterized membrane-anchored protein